MEKFESHTGSFFPYSNYNSKRMFEYDIFKAKHPVLRKKSLRKNKVFHFDSKKIIELIDFP